MQSNESGISDTKSENYNFQKFSFSYWNALFHVKIVSSKTNTGNTK